jgi:hypothetical protein
MAKLLSAASSRGHETVQTLFEAGGPLLVEVRFPGGVASSDWYLCDSEDEFDSLLIRLGASSVLHVSRVWDLTNPAGSLVLRR